MKKSLVLVLSALLLTGCAKHEISELYQVTDEQINENVEKVFGTTFSPDQDWCSTKSGVITVTGIPSSIDKVQLMVCVAEADTTTSMAVLNETEVNGESTVTLSYDAPKENLGMYVAFISKINFTVIAVEGETVAYSEGAKTRASFGGYEVPDNPPSVSSFVTSYAKERGWNPDDKLYELTHYSRIGVAGYSDAMTSLFRTIVFSYFKNGRAYNNLPLVKQSGYYNDNAYPITTGDKPILVSPVYKCDAAKKYGNEVYNSDLYYYYYPANANATVEYLKSLPKYKAIPFNGHFGENEDDVIQKRASYVLAYFGDGVPAEGTQGTYQFPSGYKIGFMVRAKTDYAEGNPKKPRKQGELYGDGRLNSEINTYSECNFKSSKLGSDGPRIAWLTVNNKMFMCWESGTDSDFNDIILEVEGGIKPIIIIPDIEEQCYTFCFEDTPIGDYDMNDVVIKAKRINETTVEYSIVACGAYDEIYIGNINGRVITGTDEVHKMFKAPSTKYYVNTESGGEYHNPITERITVSSSFSFLDESTQPYIIDRTINRTVKLAKKGEDPHGIMIPNDFKYPLEKVCVKDAYNVDGHKFNSWGDNPITSTDWYKYPVTGKVY